jgi:hypothetical protein
MDALRGTPRGGSDVVEERNSETDLEPDQEDPRDQVSGREELTEHQEIRYASVHSFFCKGPYCPCSQVWALSPFSLAFRKATILRMLLFRKVEPRDINVRLNQRLLP